MYKNGKNIYDTLNIFSNIPMQVINDKTKIIFNTDNDIKKNFLNDKFIYHLENSISYKLDRNSIIKHILFCLRPVIHQNINNINIEEYKYIIRHTLEFKIYYMIDINTQLDFLFDKSTIYFILDSINKQIPNNKVEYKYIESILKNNIDNHTKNKREINSSNISIKYNIYINQATLFTEKELFHIIDNTINSIIKNITTENNNIIQHNKMDRWNTVLGHNNNDIKQNINVKLNTKRPQGMQFNMNY